MGKNMIKFKLNDKEYKLPEHITIGQYIKIYKIKDLFTEDYFAAKLLNLVCDVPLEEVMESDYQEVHYLALEILNLLPLKTPQFKDRFTLDGVNYGFFPNWRDLTFAEFMDLDTISTKKSDELLDMLHILCAIMYRPITEERSEHDFDIEKYDIKSMQKRAELFKNKLNCNYIISAQFFFINYAKRYSGYFQLSLIKTLSTWTKIKLVWSLRKMIMKGLFKRSTDGSLSSINYLEMIIQNTK
jgi:hypothetical protein